MGPRFRDGRPVRAGLKEERADIVPVDLGLQGRPARPGDPPDVGDGAPGQSNQLVPVPDRGRGGEPSGWLSSFPALTGDATCPLTRLDRPVNPRLAGPFSKAQV